MQVHDTRQNVRLAILLEMLEDVSRATEPERAVQAYAARIGKLRPVDIVLSVSVRNMPEGQYKITRKVIAENGEPRHHIFDPWRNWRTLASYSGGFIGELIATPEPRLIHDLFLRDDPVVGDLLAEMGSCVAIPVFDGGRVLNWTLQFRRDPRGFTMDELEQNVLTGNLFGAMTKNLVVLEEIKALNRRLREQFEEVARVQQALLPRSTPRTPGLKLSTSYLPSDQAGGDYYDFADLPGDQVAMIIADVSGHGPGAATVMAMLRAIVHAFPEGHAGASSPSPADVMRFANRQLLSTGMDGAFTTAIIASFDRPSRTLWYANAGHPPARLVGPDMMPATLQGESTLPLGIVEDIEVPLNRVALAPGQGIVFYTDGITEAFNDRREMLGVEGLDRAIAGTPPPADPDALIYAIHGAVFAHTGKRTRDDDQTLMVMRVVEE